MTYARQPRVDSIDTLPWMPSWITSGRAETLEDVTFLSGAALSHLHLVLSDETVPHGLLRSRLALRAAEASLTYQGRPERAKELRDAVAFLQPGDSPGPAGEIYMSWGRAVERPISVKALKRALPGSETGQIAEWLDAGQGGPVARAAVVLETILTEAPREEVAALILADAALSEALGWGHVVPLLVANLKRTDLRKRGEVLRAACHRAVIKSAIEAVRQAADLSCRAAHLIAITPKLRAKGSGEAVQMFLNRDAVAPSSLPLPDRAARRLCDRLMDLGAIRELTGRDTFRLYGV